MISDQLSLEDESMEFFKLIKNLSTGLEMSKLFKIVLCELFSAWLNIYTYNFIFSNVVSSILHLNPL